MKQEIRSGCLFFSSSAQLSGSDAVGVGDRDRLGRSRRRLADGFWASHPSPSGPSLAGLVCREAGGWAGNRSADCGVATTELEAFNAHRHPSNMERSRTIIGAILVASAIPFIAALPALKRHIRRL